MRRRPPRSTRTDTLLPDTTLVRSADKWLPDALATLARGGSGIRGCERPRALFADARPVTEEDYDTEYLAPINSVRVVDSIDDAIAHIQPNTTHHPAAIYTPDHASADQRQRVMDGKSEMVRLVLCVR